MTTTPDVPSDLSRAASERILRTVHREMAADVAGHESRHRARRVLVGSLAFVGAGSLLVGGYVAFRVRSVERVDIHVQPGPVSEVSVSADAPTASTTATAVAADLRAQNFLIVGSDSRDCIDPNAPNAGAFVGQEATGENADTIMLVRAEPSAPSTVLSFPRDLWVKVPGTERSAKINSLYARKNPAPLVRTIEENFALHVDHYVEIDFCGFKAMVDAVGGVKVPFVFPAFDKHTGLNVDAGCHTFMGEEALAYVRSRYYQWFDGGVWHDDGDGDLSRVSRQQDFVKRLLQTAVDRGATNPVVAKRLLDAVTSHLIVDKDLTIADLVRLAATLRADEPDRLRGYRLEGVFSADGEAIVSDFDLKTNKAILSVFRGEATLASTASPSPEAPTVDVAENPVGVVPATDPACR
jgi:LCP family protein required for cell wall assembly